VQGTMQLNPGKGLKTNKRDSGNWVQRDNQLRSQKLDGIDLQTFSPRGRSVDDAIDIMRKAVIISFQQILQPQWAYLLDPLDIHQHFQFGDNDASRTI
jgi:hypothetical protein